MVIKTREELSNFFIKQYIDKIKVDILKLLIDNPDLPRSMAKKLNISDPLLSYHLNGNARSYGLIDIGLAKRVHDDKGILKHIEITSLGKEILETVFKKKLIEVLREDTKEFERKNAKNIFVEPY